MYACKQKLPPLTQLVRVLFKTPLGGKHEFIARFIYDNDYKDMYWRDEDNHIYEMDCIEYWEPIP